MLEKKVSGKIFKNNVMKQKNERLSLYEIKEMRCNEVIDMLKEKGWSYRKIETAYKISGNSISPKRLGKTNWTDKDYIKLNKYKG